LTVISRFDNVGVDFDIFRQFSCQQVFFVIRFSGLRGALVWHFLCSTPVARDL